MRKTDYHMHTRRCICVPGRDEEYVISVIKNGYEEVGSSDYSSRSHDSDSVTNMRVPLSKFDDYYASVLSSKGRYKNHISVKIGLEYEYFPKYIGWLKQSLIDRKLDYITFGNHRFKTDEKRVYFGTVCKEEAWLIAYMDEAIAGMKTDLYSYPCHPNLFMRGRRVFDEVAKCESIRLCQAARELHIPLEYNLVGAAHSGIMHTIRYPHTDLQKTATEAGNTAIIGVNVHEPATLETDSYREEGTALFSGLGMEITDTLSLEDLISYERGTYVGCGG